MSCPKTNKPCTRGCTERCLIMWPKPRNSGFNAARDGDSLDQMATCQSCNTWSQCAAAARCLGGGR